jgi:hypothetical protein
LKSGEKKNPYDIGNHKEGCPENIWDSPSELLGFEEIRERKCEACKHEYKLWQSILKYAPGEGADPITMYGDLAFRGLNLHSRIVDLHCPAMELEPFDFELLQIVHGAIKTREAFHIYEKNKESKEQ